MKRIGEREDPIWKTFIEDKNKKPDADKDGVPDWADKKHGKDDHTGKDLEHNWATHVAPVGADEDEEFRVVDHSLTPQGIIEEYYVDVNGFLVTMKARDVKIIREQSHGHPPKKKKK